MKASTSFRVRRIMLASIVAGLSAVFPVAAQAADVGVVDNSFNPSRIAVKPGETVTWTNPGSGEQHNLRFEDRQGAELDPSTAWNPPSRSRTFSTEGAFPYYCEIHGARGGAGMAGVVYVNSAGDLPPVAQLTVSPGVVLAGQTVSFDGSTSSDRDGSITKYEWDLDGDGTFETNTGTTATTSRSYPSPATLSVKLRVTDDKGFADVRTQPLKINAVPTASFTASPSPAQTGQTVGFDAGGSSDSDGTIAQYEWDLDGNGAFETTTTSPTVSYSYLSPATLTVRLRVTDSDGAKAETTRALQINAAPVPPQPTPQQQSTPVPQTTSKPKPSSTSTKSKPGKCSKLKGKKRAACIKKSCRKLKGAKMKACVKKVTRKS